MILQKSGLIGTVLLFIIIIAISACTSAELKGARDGDLSAVQEFVESGGDINERQKNGSTLLMYASAGGHIHIIDYLMSAGADLRLRDNRGFSALMYGAEANKKTSVVSLLSYGADVDDYSSNGQTSLLIAAGNNFSGIVETLIRSGADYNLADNNDWTPLLAALNHSAASSNGVTHSFMLIKNAGATLTSRTIKGSPQPYKLVKNEESSSSGAESSYKLVQNNVTTRDESSSLVSSPKIESIAIKAVSSGNRDVLTILFLEGFNPEIIDRNGNSLLHLAVGDVEMLRFLLSWDVDINLRNRTGETPLLAAAKEGIPESVSLFLQEGADYNIADNSGWTPLLSALNQSALSNSGLTPTVPLLQNMGARLDLPSTPGDSIVFNAVKSGNLDVLELLFQEGANPLIRDSSGNTLMHLGIKNLEMVRFLLKWKVDINSRNNSGIPVLHMAVENPSEEVLNLLLIQGINVFATDNSGNSALHVAALKGEPQMVRQLLLAGIFVNSTNSAGMMPYDLSFENTKNGEEIRTILKMAGAIIPEVETVAVEDTKTDPADAKDSSQTTKETTSEQITATDLISVIGTPETIVEPETETQQVLKADYIFRFSWPRINPSKIKQWNNSDKLTGRAILELLDSENKTLLSEEILLPMKGVNADAHQIERTVVIKDARNLKGVLTLFTEKNKTLNGQVISNFSGEDLTVIAFEEFEYR